MNLLDNPMVTVVKRTMGELVLRYRGVEWTFKGPGSWDLERPLSIKLITEIRCENNRGEHLTTLKKGSASNIEIEDHKTGETIKVLSHPDFHQFVYLLFTDNHWTPTVTVDRINQILLKVGA